MRVASLLPSATERVCALGLESDLVGIRHECDFPASVVVKPCGFALDRTRAELDVLRELLRSMPWPNVSGADSSDWNSGVPDPARAQRL